MLHLTVQRPAAPWLETMQGYYEVAPGGECEIWLRANRQGLSPGEYRDTVSVTSDGGNASFEVILTVPPPRLPRMEVDGGPTINIDSRTARISIMIRNRGDALLHWQITPDLPAWLSADRMSGRVAATAGSQFEISINRAGLSPGTYEHTLSIASDGGNASKNIRMAVAQPAALPDVIVKSINIESERVRYGRGAWVTFTVKNEGQAPVAGSIFLQKEVTKDGVVLPKSGYFEIKGGLAPGEEKSHRFKVGHDNSWPAGNYTVRVIADYRNQIPESSEGNNASAAIQFNVVQ